MFGILLLAFIIVPIIEIYLIIQVGSAIGGWETIALLIADSMVGAWLVRREGFSIIAKVNQALTNGKAPTDPLIDGLLVLIAGALMLTPGFLTDGVGFLLLLPPTRALLRNYLKHRFKDRIDVGGGAMKGFGFTPGGGARGATWTETHGTDVTGDGGHEDPPDVIDLGPPRD